MPPKSEQQMIDESISADIDFQEHKSGIECQDCSSQNGLTLVCTSPLLYICSDCKSVDESEDHANDCD